MNLSPNFTLEEMTVSQSAARRNIDNNPPTDVLARLKRTAHGLELVRAIVGCPIVVSSGYRSPLVNQLVGGARNSQHLLGGAADITAPGFGAAADLVRAIVDSDIQFDQCILEYGAWCHISFDDTPRRQALVIDHNGRRTFV